MKRLSQQIKAEMEQPTFCRINSLFEKETLHVMNRQKLYPMYFLGADNEFKTNEEKIISTKNGINVQDLSMINSEEIIMFPSKITYNEITLNIPQKKMAQLCVKIDETKVILSKRQLMMSHIDVYTIVKIVEDALEDALKEKKNKIKKVNIDLIKINYTLWKKDEKNNMKWISFYITNKNETGRKMDWEWKWQWCRASDKSTIKQHGATSYGFKLIESCETCRSKYPYECHYSKIIKIETFFMGKMRSDKNRSIVKELPLDVIEIIVQELMKK
jgi:hypothetical protein